MKKTILIIALTYYFKVKAIVDFFGVPSVIPKSYGPSCLGKQYVQISWAVNWELNNNFFQVERSMDPNFSWAITSTALFNGIVNGCGTCGQGQYTVLDYGPFQPGEVWFYRIKAVSFNSNFQYKNAAGPYVNNIPTVVNWINQVTHHVKTGSSPSTETSYQWMQETKEMQGVTISLMPTEIAKIYLEQNNHKLSFSVQENTPFVSLDVNINNGGYFNLYNGGGSTSHIWHNASSYLTNLGNYNLKVRFTALDATVYYREYEVYVVPKSDGLFVDNYCNTMRVWKGNDPLGATPIVLSEGFDAYNTRSEQYYRKSGDALINCLLNKGFDVYVVNYYLNSQSIKNNAAVFQSAVRYVSSINSNRKVIAAGMSMGGIINRLACAKAEDEGNPLPIKKFLSLDAPHQGAVISKELQDWRKNITIGDAFAEHALNNEAAYELLRYHTYDTLGTFHNNFFNYLNNVNGDGYPHLVQKIGVSFSTNSQNPNSYGTKWLFVHVKNVPGNHNKNFHLGNEETLPGSFLPSLNMDPMYVYSPEYWVIINTYRSFLDPIATVIQYADPTFIPYNSALDIVSGISKFDKIIVPNTTGYHDVVPSEIIEPLVNSLIDDKVYIQNKNYNNETRTIIANETICAGNNIEPNLPIGDVNIHTGTNIIFKSAKEIKLMDGVSINVGANFSAIIDLVKCDGNTEFQNMRTNSNSLHDNDIQTLFYSPENYQAIQKDYDSIQIDTKIYFYPNPNDNGFLNITSSDEDGKILFQLYDVSGNKIFEHITFLSNYNATIYLPELKNGIYIAKINHHPYKLIISK